MKNYYDQQRELQIAKARKETLEYKRSLYFYRTQPKATVIKDTVVMVEPHNDVYLEYLSKVEKIDRQLKEVNEEINILEDNLNKMAKELRCMKSKLAKVFADVYIDGLTVKQTAIKENYSESHIYTLLDGIKKIINGKK